MPLHICYFSLFIIQPKRIQNKKKTSNHQISDILSENKTWKKHLCQADVPQTTWLTLAITFGPPSAPVELRKMVARLRRWSSFTGVINWLVPVIVSRVYLPCYFQGEKSTTLLILIIPNHHLFVAVLQVPFQEIHLPIAQQWAMFRCHFSCS